MQPPAQLAGLDADVAGDGSGSALGFMRERDGFIDRSQHGDGTESGKFAETGCRRAAADCADEHAAREAGGEVHRTFGPDWSALNTALLAAQEAAGDSGFSKVSDIGAVDDVAWQAAMDMLAKLRSDCSSAEHEKA